MIISVSFLDEDIHGDFTLEEFINIIVGKEIKI